MDRWREAEGKRVHDPFYQNYCDVVDGDRPTAAKAAAPPAGDGETLVRVVDGPIIVGAGPSGLAVAACLGQKGVPSVVLERSDGIASLWRHKTYDRLRLHLPKQFCELPHLPFPAVFPTYPTKQQFLAYLEAYARRFGIEPLFNQAVDEAGFDRKLGLWRVKATTTTTTTTRRCREEEEGRERPSGLPAAAAVEYLCPLLVVATGENAEAAIPEIEGAEDFEGSVVHTSAYRRGDAFQGKKVLVVGCGNSGMEICLDLCNYDAHPTLVVRDPVHVLPREMLGCSTFGLSLWLLKWLPVGVVDALLLLLSRLMLGDTARVGLERPNLGPLRLKAISGKTPVLDVGTLAKINSGDVKVRPAIKRLTGHGAQFVDGRTESFDAVVLATGYRSNVPSWLKETELFSEKTGLPRKGSSLGWKGENGLYAVGFTRRGILGASADAKRIASDINSRLQGLRPRQLPATFAANPNRALRG